MPSQCISIMQYELLLAMMSYYYRVIKTHLRSLLHYFGTSPSKRSKQSDEAAGVADTASVTVLSDSGSISHDSSASGSMTTSSSTASSSMSTSLLTTESGISADIAIGPHQAPVQPIVNFPSQNVWKQETGIQL